MASVVVVLLSGCASEQSPLGAPTQEGAKAYTSHSEVRTRTSSSGDLLYVGSQSDGVFVLSYPQGQIINQFQPPNDGVVFGMCSDESGDVFVLAGGTPGYIYEYAHGGTSPIATLEDEYDVPLACAVDPTTGNLAVVNNGDPTDVAIYADAQGTPTYYNDPSMDAMYYCVYDDSGNLFVDGQYDDTALLDELPYGGTSFAGIALNKRIARPGSMQWMGTYLALGIYDKIVYHVQISGSSGRIVGKTVHHHLKSPWTIDGKQLISVYGRAPVAYPFEVAYWTYPRGGPGPTQLLNVFGSHSRLDGVAVSVGSGK